LPKKKSEETTWKGKPRHIDVAGDLELEQPPLQDRLIESRRALRSLVRSETYQHLKYIAEYTLVNNFSAAPAMKVDGLLAYLVHNYVRDAINIFFARVESEAKLAEQYDTSEAK
jgi:hypothetical protein